jgi:hypothetical protein
MRPGIMPFEAISVAYLRNPVTSSTDTTTSKTVEALPRCPNQSSWNLVCISCHLRPSHWLPHKSLPLGIPTLQPPKLYCFIEFIKHTHYSFLSTSVSGPVTVAERSKACTVFARSEAGIVGTNLLPGRYELTSDILFLYTAGHGSRAI